MDIEDGTGRTLEKIDAILRVKLGLDPDTLSDSEWAKRFQEWNYVKALECRAQEAILKKVLYELAAKIYGGKK